MIDPEKLVEGEHGAVHTIYTGQTYTVWRVNWWGIAIYAAAGAITGLAIGWLATRYLGAVLFGLAYWLASE